ncbi:MAG: hypothetical protein CVV47_07715 [Spirochaetae bacterium HGW-Spirochaetae-3]|nr:MAG: hypothetical protein CVV47_07715 [Spirochaetae bacterium HGW-Spirochaetae-3]
MPSCPRIRSTLLSIGIFASAVLVGLGSTSQFKATASSVSVASVRAARPPEGDRRPAAVPATAPVSPDAPYRLFPASLFPPRLADREAGRSVAYGPAGPASREADLPAPSAPTAVASPERQSLLAGNQILAFYGKPGAPSMGIVGEYSKEKLAPLLEGYAKLYDDVNGALGVVPAVYLIFGTCWPEGEIGLLKSSVVESYIEFAAERGWVVFLDHQLGKYGVEASVRSMLPYLRYPNVHLAIDPEWRTLKPMQEIGSITGAELNEAQRIVDDYLRENDLPGIRMLVVHQFKPAMIRDSGVVRAGLDRVVLVHTADGFGSPSLKKNAYASNARSVNMPVKGFKLFFESKVVGAGWDKPLMRPEEVVALDPMPLVVMYQ